MSDGEVDDGVAADENAADEQEVAADEEEVAGEEQVAEDEVAEQDVADDEAAPGGDGAAGDGEVPEDDPPHEAGGVHTWGWHAVRASGLVLAVMVPIHVVVTYAGTDLDTVSASSFLVRWRQPGWRAFDWVFVLLGLAHGVAGLRPVLDRGIARPAVRGAVSALLFSTAAMLAALVTLAAFTVEF